MGISIDIYRQAIGQYRNPGQLFIKKFTSHRKSKLPILSSFIWILLLINNFAINPQYLRICDVVEHGNFEIFKSSNVVNGINSNTINYCISSTTFKYSIRRIVSQEANVILTAASFSWPYASSSSNKLCHSLYGNRRIGYKIAF